MKFFNYVASNIATIKLLLCRTLVLFIRYSEKNSRSEHCEAATQSKN